MKLFKILFFISFFSLITLPQTNSTTNIVSKNEQPRYDVHAGLSKVNGFRLGGRILFSKHFSLETSIGKPLAYVFLPSTNGIILSFGMNYHVIDNKNFTFSFISTFTDMAADRLRLTYLSPTVGVMNLNKKGGHFFIRIGPYVESFSKGSFAKGVFGLNLDLGYNFVF